MITIELNGVASLVDEKSTVEDVLRSSKIQSRFCAVELNLEIVPKEQYSTRSLVDGDKLEIVTLVGGG
jgi:sulfur carrier protein